MTLQAMFIGPDESIRLAVVVILAYLTFLWFSTSNVSLTRFLSCLLKFDCSCFYWPMGSRDFTRYNLPLFVAINGFMPLVLMITTVVKMLKLLAEGFCYLYP